MKIGMFDSGLGGLTVLREVTRILPELSIDYFGDTARVPYGNKSGETIIRYSEEIAEFLLAQEIDLLAIACNTASAYALPTLSKKLPIPVVGVIEPGARRAAKTTKTGKIGVFATKATVRSGAYEKALKALNPAIEVVSIACPLLVHLVEENYVNHPAAELIVQDYLSRLQGVDTLLLGCTHYPLLLPLLKRLSPLQIVDSASTLAEEVKKILQPQKEEQGKVRFFVSDDPLRFKESGSHFLGCPLPDVELVGERVLL